MAKRKREWAEDPETTARIQWAIAESRRRLADEPWAAVVLAQVALEVALSWVVHVLTERQEPAMREWIEGLRVTALSRDEDVALVNALLAPSGERIDDDAKLWSSLARHVKRRNAFIHRGKLPTRDEARDSLAACADFHDRLVGWPGRPHASWIWSPRPAGGRWFGPGPWTSWSPPRRAMGPTSGPRDPTSVAGANT
jgi:hypothetical protein